MNEQPKSKNNLSNMLVGSFVLIMILLICVCGIAYVLRDDTIPLSSLNYNDPAPGFFEIRSNMDNMTEVQWEEYKEKIVIGKTALNWKGYVKEVSQESSNLYEIRIDMDPPNADTIADLFFKTSDDRAKFLQKGQLIVFSGRISSVVEVFSNQFMRLENAEINY